MHCVLHGGPDPFTWNNSISLALNLCILTWTTPHGLNVISATPHSTYNVVPGSHWPLSGTSASFALFSAAESFRSTCRHMSLDYSLPSPPSWIILVSVEIPSENTCSRFTSVLLVLKMAQKQLCPDRSNGTLAKKKKNQPRASGKKTPPSTTPKSSKTAHHRDSADKNKKIGLFTADSMRKCMKEVKAVALLKKKDEETEALKAKPKPKPKPKKQVITAPSDTADKRTLSPHVVIEIDPSEYTTELASKTREMVVAIENPDPYLEIKIDQHRPVVRTKEGPHSLLFLLLFGFYCLFSQSGRG